MWAQRDLSLLGRITVLKSLAFSKVIYQCANLSIPESVVSEIEKSAFNFIWSGKPEKIKRKTVIANYESGGLRMLDVRSFIQAQRVMWAKRLNSGENEQWKAYPLSMIEKLLGKDTFRISSEMKKKDKPEGLTPFYWEVCKAWLDIKNSCNEIKTTYDVRRECIWLNKEIKIEGKEIKWIDWYEKGIVSIHDIVDERGEFLEKKLLDKKYGIKGDEMKYNMIKSAIPMAWKKALKKSRVTTNAISNEENPHLQINKNPVDMNLLTNRKVYWCIIDKIKIEPVVFAKWERELQIGHDEWKEIFRNGLVVKETKLRTFQYKVIYNLIPCGLYLKRIEKAENDKCPFCGKLDDIIHYFGDCHELQSFWQSFASWWAGISHRIVELDLRTIMFGGIEGMKLRNEFNICLIVAKWHIYKEKLSGSLPFFYKFLCEMKYRLNIERYIAARNNKLAKFETDWDPILDEIT
jgi:hypothetical protein